jgi:hypothetical protein
MDQREGTGKGFSRFGIPGSRLKKTMVLPKTEEEWGTRASTFLKAEMEKADVAYAELAKRLKKHGLKETEAGITMKLKRGDVCRYFFPRLPGGDGAGGGDTGGDLGAGSMKVIGNIMISCSA